MGTRSIIKKNYNNNKACDQCNRRHARCCRQKPICHSCKTYGYECTWDREPNFIPDRVYQNIKTFSFKSSKFIFKPVQTSQRLILVTDWQKILNKWFDSSVNRIFYSHLIKLSGIPLERASCKERQFLADVLLKKIKVLSLDKRKSFNSDYRLIDNVNILNEAKEAFFKHFNTNVILFTRNGYESQPRSWLLKLAIWQTGLRFLPDSTEKRVLANYLDSQIVEATRPSRMIFSLDTLQAYLILIIGLFNSKVSRFWLLTHAIESLFYALGLHRNSSLNLSLNSKLERILAYRIVVLLDITSVFVIGRPSQFYIDASPRCPIPKYIFAFYFESLKCLDFNQIATSNMFDLCFLIINECVSIQFEILLKINTKLQNNLNGICSTTLLIDYIYLALNKLQKLFLSFAAKLQNIRKLYQMRVPIMSSDPILQIFVQMKIFLAIQFHYSRLTAFSIATHMNPTVNDILSHSFAKKKDSFITSGTHSAYRLIRLLSILGDDSFFNLKISYLSTAAIFIIRNFHTYCKIISTHKSLDVDPLKAILRDAESKIKISQSNTFFSYQASYNIVFFDALLVHHKLTL